MSVGAAFGVIITGAGVFRARRIEAGLLNAGSDFDETTTPFAAGLGDFVRLRQGRLHWAHRAPRRRPLVSNLGHANRSRCCPSWRHDHHRWAVGRQRASNGLVAIPAMRRLDRANALSAAWSVDRSLGRDSRRRYCIRRAVHYAFLRRRAPDPERGNWSTFRRPADVRAETRGAKAGP